MSDFKARIEAELDTSKVEQQIKGLENQKIKIKADTGTASTDIKKVDNNLKTASASANTFGSNLRKALSIGSSAAVVAKGFQIVRNSVRDAIEATKEFDSCIKDIRTVTGTSFSEATVMLRQYNAVAKELGATTKEISDAAVTWLRQGKSTADTNKLIEETMKLSKVGMIDSGDAAKYLTSALNGYKLSVEDAAAVVDKLTMLDSSAAVTAAGLAEAMSKTAVSANTAGVSMDQLLGYLAAVGEVSQEPMSVVGNAFKTFFARYSDIKSNKLELIDEDGTIETLSDVEQSLKNVGIDMRSMVTDFDNAGDVLDNLAKKWNTLNGTQQSAIAKAFGGVRGKERFLTLMDNYSNAQKYMESAVNSAGNADQKFAAYADSIEAKTKSLQAAFESLATNTLSSEMFGGIIDAATNLTEFLDKTHLVQGALAGLATIGAVKGFTVLATGIASAYTKLNEFNTAMQIVKAGNIGEAQIDALAKATANLSTSQLKAVLSSEALSTEQRIAILTSQGMSAAEAKAALATMGLSTAEGTATASTLSLTAAAKGLWATLKANPFFIVATAVTAAVSMYSSYKQKVEEAKRAEEEAHQTAIQTAQDNINKRNQEIKTLQDAISQYKQYKDVTQLTAEQKQNLTAIQSSLNEMFGQEAAGIDLLNGKYDESIEKLQTLAKEKAKQNTSNLQVLLDEAEHNANDNISPEYTQSKVKAYQNKEEISDDNYRRLVEMANNISQLKLDVDYHTLSVQGDVVERWADVTYGLYKGTSETMAKQAKAALDSLDELRTRTDEETQALVKSEDYKQLYSWLNDQYNHYSEEAETLKKAYADMAENIAQTYEKTIDGTKYDIYNLSSDVFEDWQNALISDYEKTNPKLAEAIKKYLSENYNQITAETQTAMDDGSKIVLGSIEEYQERLSAAAEKSKTIVTEISSIQDVLNKQKAGTSISADTFDKEELLEYRSALEYVNGTMQLNADKVREIIQAKTEEQVALNNTNKALEQAKYLENAKMIEQYRASLRDASLTNGEARRQIQDNIDALLEENSVIAANCQEYDLLTATLIEATGVYQNWLNAQSAADYGDMFNDALNAIERIRDTFNETSDIFGDFGSKKFDAAVDFIVPDTVDKEDTDAIEKYMNDFKQYLTFDDNGNANGMNIDKFLENAVDKGLMVLDEKSGEFLIAGNKTMEDFAKGLNMSSGMVQAFFDELQLKGGEFDWSDEAIKTIGDLAIEANEAAEALRNLDGNSNLAIKMDVSDLQDTETQLAALDKTIAEMDTLKAKPGIDTTDIDNANTVIQYCLMQKQLLSQPDVMRVDTSQVEGDIGNVIAKLQEFQNAKNNLEILQKIGADTTDAESKVNSLTAEIQAISPEIKAKLSIDTTSTESISTSLAGLTAETINVKCGVDATAIEGYNPDSKTCDVIYNPDTDLLPQSFDSIDRTVNYVANTANLPTYFSTITRYVKYVKTGDVSVNGTAHAGGTAYASGNWGTAPGGQTLVGELGQEIVVDPRTGQWYTVGDNGAEFRDIPAGAIVFNHNQSKSLLENGFVAGRGHALIGGTALVRGHYKPPTKKDDNGGSNGGNGGSNGGGNNNYNNNNGGGGNNNSSPSSNEKEEEPQVFDWIEIAIDRIERAISKLKTTAESAFKSYKKRLSATSKAMKQITMDIETQEKAYKRYMEQADSVELSDDLKEKVKNGTIDINEYDSETQDLIKDYQEWIEKALDVDEAIQKLHEDLAQLYKDNFDNIQEKFEHQLSLYDHLTKTYETGIRALEAKGYMQSTEYYNALSNAEKKNIKTMEKELAELEKSFSEAMASGEIDENSAAYYEMQEEINKVKEQIDAANVSLLEYKKTMREIKWGYFDYVQERIKQITQETDFLIDLMSSADLFNDNGQLSDKGLATMGLRGENLNVYMAQADAYAEEILKLDKEIAKDPYNTDLVKRREEMLKLQQESIKAAENEKQAIIDLVEQGIKIELENLKKLIDGYSEALLSSKDLYEYQKKIKSQTSEIAKLNKMLSAYAGDTSEENRARVQKITVDLAEAQEKLAETEYEQFVTESKKLLDELYSEYEEILNERLDNVDVLIEDMIDTINDNSADIAQTLKEVSDEVGYTISDENRAIWSNDGAASAIISKYGDNFSAQFTTVNQILSSIEAKVASMVKESDTEAKEEEKKTTPTTEPTKPDKPGDGLIHIDPPVPKKPEKKKRTDKENYGVALAIINGNCGWGNGDTRKKNLEAKGFDYNTVQGIVNKLIKEGYVNSGAWVGRYHGIKDLSPYHIKKFKLGGLVDYTGLAQLDGTPQKPELVLNAQDTENYMQLTKALRDKANIPLTYGDSEYSAYSEKVGHNIGGAETVKDMLDKFSKFEGAEMNVTQHFDLGGIQIDHVQDYNDFVTQLQQDRKFEKMINAMTLDRLTGGSSLAKNKYKWN